MEPSSYYRSHTTLEPSSPCKRLTEAPIKDTSGEFSQQFLMRFAEGVELGTEPEGEGSVTREISYTVGGNPI